MKQITGPKLIEDYPSHKPEMCSPAWCHEDKTTRYRYCIYCTSYIVIANFHPTLLAVLRIQDVEPVSRFFYIQDSGSRFSEVFLTEKLEKLGLDPGFGIRDPGSEKNVSRILDPDPLVKKNTVSRIQGLDQQLCLLV
jgi:hypothetical protein